MLVLKGWEGGGGFRGGGEGRDEGVRRERERNEGVRREWERDTEEEREEGRGEKGRVYPSPSPHLCPSLLDYVGLASNFYFI